MIRRDELEKIGRSNLNFIWSLVDRWFSVVQYSILLGFLYYAKEIDLGNSVAQYTLELIYWVSFGALYIWFLELGELVSIKFWKSYATDKIYLLRYGFATGLTAATYLLITETLKGIGSL